MLCLIIFLTLLSEILAFHLYMGAKAIAPNDPYNINDYEIPKWAEQKFKKNKIPKFSEYHKKNKKPKPKNNFISIEEAHYNAIKHCNLPFGLLQK